MLNKSASKRTDPIRHMKLTKRSKNKTALDGGAIASGGAPIPKPKSSILKRVKLPVKSEYVLTIGDEGAILVHLQNKQTVGRWFASSASEENIETLSKAVAAHPRAPITVVLDTMDQHYSQQTLPPVSKLSVNGLLKRRAMREFGRLVELKGHYFLGQSATKEWSYMMYAMEIGEHVQAWLDWVLRQSNRPKGVRVLPLDVAAMILALDEQASLPKKAEDAADDWAFFVSYNKVSGIRQIILRDGKMVFTRLGQSLEGDFNTEAGAIEQEVISTVEYLKRIGMKTIHDLRLTIIASQETIGAIDAARIGVVRHTLLTPFDAAQIFGWSGIVQPEDRYGDVLLASFVAGYRGSKHVLWTKPLKQIKQLYLALPAVRALGVVVVLASLAYVAMAVASYVEFSGQTEQYTASSQALQQQLTDVREKVNVPPEELDKKLQLYDIYSYIRTQKLDVGDFFLRLAWAFDHTPKAIRVQALSWRRVSPEVSGGTSAAPPVTAPSPSGAASPPEGTPVSVQGEININLLASPDIHSEALQVQANAAIDQLRPYFPYYQLTLAEVPQARSVGDSVNINLNQQASTTSSRQLKRVTTKIGFSGVEYVLVPKLESGGRP